MSKYIFEVIYMSKRNKTSNANKMKKNQETALTPKAKIFIVGAAGFAVILASAVGYGTYKNNQAADNVSSPAAKTPSETTAKPIAIDPNKKEQTININGKQVPIQMSVGKKDNGNQSKP